MTTKSQGVSSGVPNQSTNNNRPMKIKATCHTIAKQSLVSREFLRGAMLTWGWDQCKADAHLIALELGKSVSIETPKGELLLEPIE